MIKSRMIQTRFWSDNWIRKINPLDRYLFLYLLTNAHTNISGIYELPLSVIAFETGIDERDLEKSMFPRLEPKVFYHEGWVILTNFIKNQNTKSKTIQIGIRSALSDVPNDILEKAIGYGYHIDTIYIPHYISKSKSKLKSKPKDTEQSSDSFETKEWKYEDKLQEMQKSEKGIDRLLSYFWYKKGFSFENSKQLSSRYARDCKAGKQIVESGYSREQIKKTVEYVYKKYNDIDWTLETVFKCLAEANK